MSQGFRLPRQSAMAPSAGPAECHDQRRSHYAAAPLNCAVTVREPGPPQSGMITSYQPGHIAPADFAPPAGDAVPFAIGDSVRASGDPLAKQPRNRLRRRGGDNIRWAGAHSYSTCMSISLHASTV